MWIKFLKIVGAILFIVAVEVGVFTLPLPFAPGNAGLIPGFTITILIWLITYGLSLLYAEALQSMPAESNFFSLFEHHLGKSTKWLIGIPFLFFFFSYLGMTLFLLRDFINAFLPTPLPFLLLAPSFMFFLGLLLFSGLTPMIIFSSLFAFGLFIPLYFLTIESLPLLKASQLFSTDWSAILYSIPIFYGAFSFPFFVPTLFNFLNQDKKALHLVLFFGLAITSVIYLLLQFLVKGSFSEIDFWLSTKSLSSFSYNLSLIEKTEPFTRWFPSFYFFAVLTSLVGYAYIILDILFDAMKVKREKQRGKTRFYFLLFLLFPPTFLAFFFPLIFTELNDDFFSLYQLIISFFPVTIVWSIRYHLNLSTSRFLPDGKPLLTLLFLSILIILWFQGIAIIQQI